MIFKKTKKLLFVINDKNYKKFLLLLMLLVLTSILEVVGISSIMPLITSITDIEKILENTYVLWFYDYYQLDNNQLRMLIGFTSLILLLMSSLFTIFSNRELLIYGNNIGKTVSVSLFESYIHKNYLFHVESNSSELIKNITQETSRYTQNVFIPMLRLISKIIFLMISFFVLAYINLFIALSSIISIVSIYSVIYFILRSKLSSNGEKISKCNSNRFKLLNESFFGIKETKMMGLEKEYVDEFSKNSMQISTSTASSQSISIIPKSIIEFFLFGGLIFIILYLVFVDKINEYLPVLTLFLFMGYRTLPALQMIYSSMVLIRSNERSIESISSYNTDFLTVEKKDNVSFKSSISVSNVTFSYPKTNTKVLRGIDFNINSNSILAITGLSGSGKTTLIDLLLGLINPSTGFIFIDGIPIENRKPFFSYVPQNVHLIDGTIKENITLGYNGVVDDSMLNKVCQQAELEGLISDLTLGIDTNVGENGSQLSGGQKQRIGLARALYRNKDIIILDEATSALDAKTETKILNSLKELSEFKTIIMITHKLDTLSFVDNIIFMEKGSIVAEGCYDMILKSCHEFKSLVENNKTESVSE
ncbi:hypothetical protein OA92_03250 [Marinomonas sp. SBI22]|uniref:ABC transporter ATP-binding protein n=1 Tax=unclassified Marinomonas TaxID=196814 RepID=UPI0007AF03C5|nr:MULTISPECIES: ABC transporter ATP-binding protein [unclassified Marinomonas]KZM44895.1 hypothetical protein OA92_03250 [Marinomonas sp. SBI22]KZM46594.1 hypothetical protein OA91_02310 [Marinomonas sp. SBI8L]